ncbi:hypothetical protein ACVC7V_25715 [Hydrogenophaga sp. A37]
MHEFPVFPVFPAVRLARLACVVGAVWSLMACQPTAPAGSPGTAAAQTTGAPKNDHSAQEHLYRVNPAPKEGFEVEFEIHDAPGPFAEFKGDLAYQSFNCNYVTSEWAGARASPSKAMPVKVSPAGKNRFVVTAYRDGMLDEDYYGKGVCHWDLTSIRVGISATGAKEDTVYVVHLVSKDINTGSVIKQHYWKGDYPRLPGAGDTSNSGRRDPSEFGPTHRANLFSITASVRGKS